MGRPASVFTIGYEGRTPADFIAVLKQAGVHRVVDVRALPLSRKRGFSKTKLKLALEAAGVEYVHLREAGNPFRHEAKNDIAKCLALYAQHVKKHPEIVEAVGTAISGVASALLCVESDADGCHRSTLTKALVGKGHVAAVKNL